MNLKALVIFSLLFAFSAPGWSLSIDKNKPMTIEADSVEMDDKKGITVYRGNIDVKQGTLHVTGNTLVIERAEGKVKTVTVVGKPARYSQRPDNKKTNVIATARKLQIYPKRDLIRLERKAKITQEGDVFTGNIIEYDNKNNIIKAKGQISKTDTGGASTGRIRMTIQPNKK
jgi:lipopolysaccharide export system protein LptA